MFLGRKDLGFLFENYLIKQQALFIPLISPHFFPIGSLFYRYGVYQFI